MAKKKKTTTEPAADPIPDAQGGGAETPKKPKEEPRTIAVAKKLKSDPAVDMAQKKATAEALRARSSVDQSFDLNDTARKYSRQLSAIRTGAIVSTAVLKASDIRVVSGAGRDLLAVYVPLMGRSIVFDRASFEAEYAKRGVG